MADVTTTGEPGGDGGSPSGAGAGEPTGGGAGEPTGSDGRVGVAPTPPEVLDQALADLRARAPAWCAFDVNDRIELLQELTYSTLAAAPAWVAAAAAAKGLQPGSRASAEDWGSGPTAVLRHLRLLERTLRDIARTGRPQPPAIRTRADGRTVIDVFPSDGLDRLLYRGFEAEAWLHASTSEGAAIARMGRIYRPDHRHEPGVALVLGAGNVSSIPPMDALHQLFAHDRVVLLELNPVNDHLGVHLADALAPLAERGFLRLAYGGAETGTHLARHAEVDAIHVTGSAATHDAIVFGTGPGGRSRKQRGEPASTTPVISELGSVTPVIVVPGPWGDRDVALQGDNLASMLVHNAGFNCIASRVIVQHRAWAKRRALLDAVRDSLRRAERREPYYPGARDRWERLVRGHRQAEWFAEPGEADVPFTLLPDLDPEAVEDEAFTTELSCGVMGEVALDAERSVVDYLDQAVRFCNEVLWGTLTATIIVHPASLTDPEVAAAVEHAVERLRYGTVVLNHFPGAAYAFVSPPWGAHPGSATGDIRSGRGVVHNTYLLEDVEKVVVRGPFRPALKPPWFHTHRTAPRLLPRLARLTATGDHRLLPGVLWDLARG